MGGGSGREGGGGGGGVQADLQGWLPLSLCSVKTKCLFCCQHSVPTAAYGIDGLMPQAC